MSLEGSATDTNLSVLRGKIAAISPNALDTSLSVEGASAEAKATGDAIHKVSASLDKHADNKNNPHGVTKKQLGLGNVDDTADVDKPVSTAQAEAISDAKKAGTDAKAALELKVDAEEGKGLSSNDFTDEYKGKLDEMIEGGGGAVSGADIINGSVTTDKVANNAITSSKLSGDAVRIRAEGVFVYASAFEYSTDYDNYPYRAAVEIAGATENMKPDVTFSNEQATSGIYCPVSESYDGGVYIYASEVPKANITIPVIDLWR